MTKSTVDISALVKERLKAALAEEASAMTGVAAASTILDEYALASGTLTSTTADMEALIKEAPPKPPVEEKKKKEVVVSEGQVLASELLGFEITNDFAVDVLKSESIPEQVRAFIPKLDPTYAVQKEESVQILRALQDGDKILVTGPTGSGKSSLFNHLCAITNRPMIRLNMSGDVESATIFGSLTARDGATVWNDGAATEAVRYGAVLVNDEWDVTPPEIMFGYQWLMEDNGKLYLKEMPGSSEEKMVTPHKNFRFVCLGNTLGQGDESGKFAGTNVQNTATLDRFQTTISLNYLDKSHEEAVLKNAVPSLDKRTIKKMLSLASLVRDAYQQGQLALSMSPRTLINWGRKSVALDNPRLAMQLAYLNKLNEMEKGVANALFDKVFGK